MKRIFNFLFFTLSIGVFAQTADNYINEKINKLISPPSQEAYKLGTFGNIPVGFINGTPNISIPLVNFKTNSIEIPFTLNYSSSGIKVDELDGVVGLGWQLNGGGVITRTVKDIADEDASGNSHFPEKDIITGINNDDYDSFVYLNHIQDPGVDSEPDIYNFSFLGNSGKFFFDNNSNVHFFDQSDLKVFKLGEPVTGYYFKILDEKGNAFLFKDSEISLFLKTTQSSTPSTHISAWYLSEVDLINGEKIYFDYVENKYEYISNISQSIYFDLAAVIIGGVTFPSSVENLNPYGTFTQRYYHKNLITGKALSQIRSENFGSINFDYVSDPEMHYPMRLVNITKFNTQNTVLEKYNLKYNITNNNRVFLSRLENVKNISQYDFEYINSSEFPQRLSFAQDIYGYYNGKLNNKNLIPQSIALEYLPLKNEINNLADRDPDTAFNKIGLLKKIVYPTKGYSLLEYFGNNQQPTQTITNVTFVDAHYNYNLGEIFTSTDDEFVQTQTAPINLNLNSVKDIYFFANPKFSTSNPKCIPLQGSDPGNQTVKIKIENNDASYSNVFTFSNTNQNRTVNLQPGNYIISVQPIYNTQCTDATIKIGDQYITAHYENSYSNLPRYSSNGSRIETIKNFDEKDLLTSQNNYKYGTYIELFPKNFKSFEGKLKQVNTSYSTNTFLHINSNDQTSYINPQAEFIYDKATISYGGNNFEKGGESHYFKFQADAPDRKLIGIENPGYNMYSYTSWENAKEYKTEIFEKNGGILKKVENNYSTRPSFNKKFYGISANEFHARITGSMEINNTIAKCPSSGDLSVTAYQNFLAAFPQCYTLPVGSTVKSLAALYNVAISQYEINSFNKFLQSQTSTDYLNGKELKTTTNYFYDNPNHYQVTKEETSFPDGNINSKLLNYAFEKNNQKLIDANMVGIPLETITLKNGKPLSKVETLYPDQNNFPTSQAGNLLLPLSVKSTKTNTISLASPPSGESKITEVTFDRYDSKGNILQYTLKTGVPVAIVWGYNQTQPIAKIEGATYAQVEPYITDIISKSNADTDSVSEQTLITALDDFRNKSNLSYHQITTYSYDPLIGVTSITPPSGIREVYHYDTTNRLQSVVDVNGNILKEFSYNYRKYTNAGISKTFTRTNCGPGYQPGEYTYTVEAGKYITPNSQAEADAMAQAEIDANGQNAANANASCYQIYYSTAKSQIFTKNNCGTGYQPGTYTYTVAAAKYTSIISQADADAQAQAEITANGQNAANANASCYQIYYNTAKSQIFTKNNCGTGYQPGTYTYTVAAAKYTSIVSQADADAQAQAEITANGQNAANANASCYQIYYNTAKSQTFTRNNCGTGYQPGTYTYTVAAAKYTSIVSQADADAQAQAEITANGQNAANTNASCYQIYYNTAKSQTFTKNNCGTGYQPGTYTYTVAAAKYTSIVSQADADAQAQAEITANGQNAANTNASCYQIYYNTAKSQTFTRTNCGTGYQPGTYTYTVTAGKYTSIVSQADAEAKAQAEINANGQNITNIIAPCYQIYYNTAKSQTFTRTNCGTGYQGGSFTYSVAAAKYTSIVSQADADAQAQAEINANGQNTANAVGPCYLIYYSSTYSRYFVKNNCPAGYQGEQYAYTVPYGKYTSIISQADADSKALADLNANGQNAANTYGTCIVQQNICSISPSDTSLASVTSYFLESSTNHFSANVGITFNEYTVSTLSVGTLGSSCRPNTTKTFSQYVGGKTWTLTIYASGLVTIQRSPSKINAGENITFYIEYDK